MLARLVYAYKIREKKLSGVIDIRLSMNNESILHNIIFNLEGLLNEFKIRPSNLEKTIKKDMDPDYSNYRFQLKVEGKILKAETINEVENKDKDRPEDKR